MPPKRQKLSIDCRGVKVICSFLKYFFLVALLVCCPYLSTISLSRSLSVARAVLCGGENISFGVLEDVPSYPLSNGWARDYPWWLERRRWLIERFCTLFSLLKACLHFSPLGWWWIHYSPLAFDCFYGLDFYNRTFICCQLVIQLKLMIYFVCNSVLLLLIFSFLLNPLIFVVYHFGTFSILSFNSKS